MADVIGPGLYGPSQGTPPPSEVTEIFYSNTIPYGVSPGGSWWNGDDSTLLSAGVSRGSTQTVAIPATWTTFDVVVVAQGEDADGGDVVLEAFYGETITAVPLSSAGTVTLAGASIQTPTEVVVATGVAALGLYGQINIARLGADPGDTYPSSVVSYGFLIRKAS